MSDNLLQEILALQKTDLPKSNQLLAKFLKGFIPYHLEEVNIRPLAVSLNSINGFLTVDGGRILFFKTHIEPNSIIDEYYNSKLLSDVGYPVLKPIFESTEWGKQLLIYEYVDSPSLFDIVHKLETEQSPDIDEDKIINLQEKLDRHIFEIYLRTLREISKEEHSKAPVHQLFHHRLTQGRLNDFYNGKVFLFSNNTIGFEELQKKKWVINGVEYKETLGELITTAIKMLNPNNFHQLSVVGHGDAHNGNVFVNLESEELVYFDPAFAGRHNFLLDCAKPLFHNVFASWMYYPENAKRQISVQAEIYKNEIHIEHSFVPHPIRKRILKSKFDLVLKPINDEAKKNKILPELWLTYLKSAMLCCPLLTMDLTSDRFFPDITLLGLSMCFEVASSSKTKNKSLFERKLESLI